jgi:hypothetical protein
VDTKILGSLAKRRRPWRLEPLSLDWFADWAIVDDNGKEVVKGCDEDALALIVEAVNRYMPTHPAARR